MTDAKYHLVFDLETVLDKGIPAPVQNDNKDSVPSAPYWQIVCIGALLADDSMKIVKLGVVEGELESDYVRKFVDLVQSRKPTLVTYNGRGFDIPILVARCMRYGIQFQYKFRKDVSYRYSNAVDGQLDLMDYLSDFGATKKSSLDIFAKLIGMPGKGSVSGSSVDDMFAAGEIKKIRAYCLSDVVQEWAIALRLHLVRGLHKDGYLFAMKSLIDAIRAEPMLEEIASTMNVPRLMLENEAQ